MTTLSHRQRIETQFVELMAELFQLDDAQALDFGLYRVIRRHNREVRSFLGEIVSTSKDTRTWQGGKLGQLLDEAFSKADDETTAAERAKLARIESGLGLKPGMTEAVRTERLAAFAGVPATKALVDDYHALKESLAGSDTAEHDRAEVLNRLYQFFSRHYQDGDFIVERRYGKGGSRYIRSTGEDTEFHWATEDMYYIKSGDIFTDYPVRLANGQRIVFAVDGDSLQATRATLKPNDKAHYEFAAIEPAGDHLSVRLKYLKGAQTDKQREDIVARIHARTGGDPADIKRWLRRYIARNQSDFFIHKRLREALADDLDIFIKSEVLDTDQLLVDKDLSRRVIKVGRIVRHIGLKIIDFLATLEDFQKALWEKKKLVFETRYVITLDRLQRYCPAWLEQHVDAIVAGQRAEWQALGLGDYSHAAACRRETAGDLATPAAVRYLPLPVHTQNFDVAFKWAMLEAVTATTALDVALDGLAIHSDNWQALNTLLEKCRNRVQSFYADPPYNTDAGPISYKNGYRKASWTALIQNRLAIARNYLLDDGVACITIDDFQKSELLEILSKEFGADNLLGTVVIKNSPSGRPSVKGFRVSHEYAVFSGISPRSDIGLLERSDAQATHFGNSDGDGSFAWENFRKRGGATTHRSARPKQFYPIYVEKDTIRIPKMEWQKDKKDWKALDMPRQEEVVLLPVNDDGTERVWSWGHVTAIKDMKDLEVRRNVEGAVSIFRKVRPQSEGSLPSTVWVKPEHSAVEYGSVLLKNMFNKREFSFPKSIHAVEDCLLVSGAHEDALVLDIFSGSGTTAHAILNLNQGDDGSRKFLIFEANDYIHAFTIPRIVKAACARTWSGGNAKEVDGAGLFMKIQVLEQYEDTLENLAIDPLAGDSEELFADNQALALRYRLDHTSRSLYCAVEHFASPFGYRLKRVEGEGEAPMREVDLVESMTYLLGVDIARLFREAEGVVMTGTNRRGQSVAIIFRDCEQAASAQWVKQKLAVHPADRVFTNAPADLSFPGCERLEAIEAVFAQQFGRA